MNKQANNDDHDKIDLQALQESEARFRSIVLWSPDAIIVTDAMGKIKYMNPAAERVFNRKLESFIGKDFSLPLVNGESNELDIFRPGKDPGVGDMHVVETEWLGEKAHLITIRDITERKRAEEALRESEKKYRWLLDNMADVITIMDMNLRFTYVSPAIMRMRGYTAEEATAQTFEQVMTPESLQIVAKVFEEEMRLEASGTADPGRSLTLELAQYRKDGSIVWMENSLSYMRDEAQKPVGIISVSRDITDRKRIEDALRVSEERFRQIAESTKEWIWEVNCEGLYTYASHVVEEMLGYKPEEIIGKKHFYDFFPADKREQLKKEVLESFVQKRTFTKYVNSNVHKNGSMVFLETSGTPMLDSRGDLLGYRGIDVDITDRKRAEEEKAKLETQLQQSQKMEAIGTLAGGIAHDFNNILTAILGYTELAISGLPQNSYTRGDLDEILKASNRAKDLVKHILMFSRHSENMVILIQLHLIIKEALKLLRSSLPATIEIKQNIQALGKVLADPTQMHQIMMNLCTNASHAMSEKGGELTVSLIQVNIVDDKSSPINLPPGPYLKLTVSDTGCGMTPAVLNRIFDPYFTTKEKDKGTGLGLAVVHGIVQSHGGLITVESPPGKGSSFHVYLPETLDSGEHKETIKAEESVFTGTERILFVDDEPVIVKMSQKILERLGYEVVGRTSSVDALELFKTKPDQFDLIITDMTMPHMTGDQLSRQLIEIRPDIPIILCTGFSEKIMEDAARKIGIREFVMKPIARQILSQTIRKVLDEAKSSTQQ